MTLPLPDPIARYFAALDQGAAAVAACFHEDGCVRDEGALHQGRLAIRRWKDKTSSAYNYTSTPVSADTQDGRTVVRCHVAGDFPGSPITLSYGFVLKGGEIAELEILG